MPSKWRLLASAGSPRGVVEVYNPGDNRIRMAAELASGLAASHAEMAAQARAAAEAARDTAYAIAAAAPLDLERHFGIDGLGNSTVDENGNIIDDTEKLRAALNCGRALTHPARPFVVSISDKIDITTPGLKLLAHRGLLTIRQTRFPAAGIRNYTDDACVLGFPRIECTQTQVLITTGQISGLLGDSSVTSCHGFANFGSRCILELTIDNFVTGLRMRSYDRKNQQAADNKVWLNVSRHTFGILGGNQLRGYFNINGQDTLGTQVRANDVLLSSHTLYFSGGFIFVDQPDNTEEISDDETIYVPPSDTPNQDCVFEGTDARNYGSSSFKARGLVNCVVASWVASEVSRGFDMGYCVESSILSTQIKLGRGLQYYYDGRPPTPAPDNVDPYQAGINWAVSQRCFVANFSITTPAALVGFAGVNFRAGSIDCWARNGTINVSPAANNGKAPLRATSNSLRCGFSNIAINNAGVDIYLGFVATGATGTRFLNILANHLNQANVRAYSMTGSAVGTVIDQPASCWMPPTVPVFSDLGSGTVIYQRGHVPRFTVATLPPARSRPDMTAKLTDGSAPGTIYSDGVDWLFRNDALVQTLSITAQPSTTLAGAALSMTVSATNLSAVAFSVLDSGGTVVAGPSLVAVTGGSAVFNGLAPAAGNGYRIRAEIPGGGAATATSAAFNSLVPPPFSFVPADLGGQLVAAFAADAGGTVIESAGRVTELRHMYDPAKKLAGFVTSGGLPVKNLTSGVPGNLDGILLDGGGFWVGTFAELLNALNGDVLTTNMAIAFGYKAIAGNKTIFQWRDDVSTSRFEFRQQVPYAYQLLVKGPTGTVQIYQGAAAQDGAWHVVLILKQGNSIKAWVDVFDPATPVFSAALAGTTGTFAAGNFVINGTSAGGGAYTPHSGANGFVASVVANGALPAVADGLVHNMMRWVGRKAGIVVA